MALRFVCLLSVFLVSFAGGIVQAQTPENRVKIRVLPAQTTIEPGQDMWIAVEQSIREGWHTYWQNPGDSGAAPNINWTLPDGFEISDIHWPVPHKIPYPPLLNYGYEDNVILLQKLKAPEVLPEEPLTLTADIDLLVCKEECIPEFHTVEQVLNDASIPPEENTAYIETALQSLPQEADWDARFEIAADTLFLTLPRPSIDFESVELFPVEWGVVENAAPAESRVEDDNIVIEQPAGDRDLAALDRLPFVAVFTDSAGMRQGYAFSAVRPDSQPASLPLPATERPDETGLQDVTILQALFLAFLGGLILNLMPCVFPVLSIKALSLVRQSQKDRVLVRLSGAAYTLGVLLSFLLIAGLLIIFKEAGAQIGWGFQLQNPVVITLLAYLLFLIGLNLSGYFEFGGRFMNLGGRLTQKEGLSGSFFTGVLATIVATPCTAPFMGVAIGFALTQTPLATLSIFLALGFGLAFPYLILSLVPALQRILPKPGTWMDTFKQFLAFPMFASAVWLVWVLSQQTSSAGVLGSLSGMLAIAFAIWLWQKAGTGIRKIVMRVLALLSVLYALFAVSAASVPSTLVPGKIVPVDGTEKPGSEAGPFGEVWTPVKLETLLAESDNPVFVEMTAAWCITCKVNHATSLNIDSTKSLFSDNNVHYLIGDWTNQDAEITQYLERYGRSGVPLYVYYGPRDPDYGERPEAVVLPQILTPGIVRQTVSGS